MANCPICSKELGFMNTPLLGVSKLMSGQSLCTGCFSKVTKLTSMSSIKNLTVESVQSMLNVSDTKTAVSLGRVEQQLKDLNIERSIFSRSEIKELPKLIDEGEDIFSVIRGIYKDGHGILVGTNKRVLFVDKGMLYGLKTEYFPLDKISSIQFQSGIIYSEIMIIASGNNATIKQVEKESGRRFTEAVRSKMSEPKHSATTVINQVDVADQILKLSDLKEKGILTQDEFEARKKKLLEA